VVIVVLFAARQVYMSAREQAIQQSGKRLDLLADQTARGIGDVTGHGMAAAFLMATTQLLVRTTLTRYHDPGRCLREVNRQLCTQGFRGQFVTMIVMVMDPA
jgi:serine phosphatase RsbU (regulator of sigma subunit)